MLPHADSPPLDPSSGEARRWLADELAKGEYSTQENPLRRAIRAAIEWFQGLFDGAAGETISAWWALAIVLALAVVIGLAAWAVARLQPGRRAADVSAGGVFDESGVSAVEYRRRAQAAHVAGDFSAAVLDAYRAIVAGAVERFVLDDRPGATARELALALGESFPDDAAALRDAAQAFGAVRYGDQHADVATAEVLLALEQRLAIASPRLPVPA